MYFIIIYNIITVINLCLIYVVNGFLTINCFVTSSTYIRGAEQNLHFFTSQGHPGYSQVLLHFLHLNVLITIYLGRIRHIHKRF